MTMTIHIKPALAARVRDEAERDGLDADAYVARALEERLEKALPASSGAATQSLMTFPAFGGHLVKQRRMVVAPAARTRRG